MTTSALHFTPMPTKWVGPIKITGEVINEAVRVPLATYETPLWPSTDRGARVSRHCGGIRCTVVDERMTRSVALRAQSAAAAKQASDAIVGRFDELAAIVGQIPEVNRLMNAFMDGAREVNPDVKFMVNFLDSWYDPPKAKESAFAMMDAGADIMYAERFGVSDAAVERGIKAIGNVIDTAADYPDTILASALWHMEATIDKAIANVASGRFEAADYGQYSFMAYGGGSLVIDSALVPADVVAKVKAREAEIQDGLFRVNVNDARPVSDK